MSPRSALGLVTATVALTAVGFVFAPSVRGACGITQEAVDSAPVVFVGALTAVTPDGGLGTFHVENVWRGTGIQAGASVDVAVADGGVPNTIQMPPDGSAQPFIVLAVRGTDGGLITNQSCAVFAFPWDDSYAAYGPGGAVPSTDVSRPASRWGPLATLVGVAALMASAAVVAFGRRGR